MVKVKNFLGQFFCNHRIEEIYQVRIDSPAERLKGFCQKCGKVTIEPLTYSHRKFCLDPSDEGWYLESEISEPFYVSNE